MPSRNVLSINGSVRARAETSLATDYRPDGTLWIYNSTSVRSAPFIIAYWLSKTIARLCVGVWHSPLPNSAVVDTRTSIPSWEESEVGETCIHCLGPLLHAAMKRRLMYCKPRTGMRRTYTRFGLRE
ncbi:hypothetical protein CBL_05978 [Carabus blaptoides fortunei]